MPAGGRLHGLLCWSLAGLVFFVVFSWLARIGDDLTWDETHNYRIYARHPVTALGLYLEPNNHPLDSLFKSISYGLLGLDRPEFYRLPGVLLVAAYLGLVWSWYRLFAGAAAWVGAALVVLLLLLGRGVHEQALVLRGYFPSMVLLLLYLLLCARRSRWIGSAQASGAANWRRSRLIYGGLSGLALFTLPTNLFVLPALWAVSLPEDGLPGGEASAARLHLRRWAELALTSGGVALVLYLPILVGFLAGVNSADNLPTASAPGFWTSLGKEPLLVLGLASPIALPRGLFSLAVIGLIVGFLLRSRARRGPAAPLIMIGLALIIPTLVAGFVVFPPRIHTVFVPILAVSLALIAHALTGHWRPRRQLALALALVALGYAALPTVARATRFHRTESEVAAFLRIRCQPETRSVLVCHDMQELDFPLHRVFGLGRSIDGEADIEETFSGEPRVRVKLDRRWKRRALEWFYPELRQPPVRPEEVEVLVFLINEEHWGRRPHLPHRNPTAWSHPALAEIRAHLPHRSEYQHDDFTIVIYEAQMSEGLPPPPEPARTPGRR